MATNTISHHQNVDSVEPEAYEILELIDHDTSKQDEINIEHYICCASARPPAFLPTTPHIPSRLEGRWSHMAPSEYRSLNRVVYSGQNLDSGLSQSEAFPPLSLDHSDIACECDVMLPIKGKHMQML